MNVFIAIPGDDTSDGGLFVHEGIIHRA